MNFGLKLLYQRERPGVEREIEVFGNSLDLISYSFPSGHTMRQKRLPKDGWQKEL
ncbi:hypothetical protein [Halalkalibacter okhensis]|uniref:hypothetical protein n=1 Tax=Halalkalibacter okhensis TaxID=333138 RepID=UPI000A7BBDE3|nr:hypothetical protein [Halalkalibacter okhensis]